MRRCVAIPLCCAAFAQVLAAQGAPTVTSQTYSTSAQIAQFSSEVADAVCSGPAGNANPGTLIPVEAGTFTAWGQIPSSTDGGTGVAWTNVSDSTAYQASNGICVTNGGYMSPAAGVTFSGPSAVGSVQSWVVDDEYSTCIGVEPVSACAVEFGVAAGATTQSTITFDYVIVIVETYSCPDPDQGYDAAEGVCCSYEIGEACGSDCSSIQCDGSCDEECGGGDCGADGGSCDGDDPIVIDLKGLGYQLTSVANGVKFDFFATGKPVQLSWTAAKWEGGFLALDRNGNGRIDNGTELFGNVTPQPTPASGKKNGFLALAVYDLPANGGNGDGWIDAQDAIYSKLVIWVDLNHDGISEPGELLTLKQAGIEAISLSYALSQWQDAFGNSFRYRSPMRTATNPAQWVYDVLLQQAAPAANAAAVTKSTVDSHE